MAKLVSVIVPVYNTRPYLRECAESVLRQTHSGLELILIDDGSQDGSAEICAALRDADPRVRFLPRDHGGVSAARNAGLDEARGAYVFFLDSDDVIHPRLLEALVELCETTGAAFATEKYLKVNAGESFNLPDGADAGADGQWSHTRLIGVEALSQFFSSRNSDHFSGIGGKLFRRRDIGALRFNPSMGNCEDTLFVYQFLKLEAAKRLGAVILWESWYAYRLRPESGSQRATIKYYEDAFQCWNHILEQEREAGRPGSAPFCMECLSFQLLELYERVRLERKEEAVSYLRAQAKAFIHGPRFRTLPFINRFALVLAFTCFPLYTPLRQVYRWLRRIRERRQAGGHD